MKKLIVFKTPNRHRVDAPTPIDRTARRVPNPRFERPALVGVALVIGMTAAMCEIVGEKAAAASQNATTDGSELRRDGNSVTIPEGSPYRDHIVIKTVEQRGFDQTVSEPAQVEADPASVYNVLPPLGGRVVDLKVGLGEHVVKGQPLVVIESGDLAQAVADVGKANAQVALTHRALDRARNLIKAGGGAVKDYESAVNDAAQADIELARAQSRWTTIAGTGTSAGARTLTVAAPSSGIVTALSIATGAYINDPTQAMMTITDLDSVWVTANVPEAEIGFVSPRQAVDVRFVAYPDRSFRSTVKFVSGIMESDTRRTKVRIALANADGRLKPNMFATVTFHAVTRLALLVPNGALLMNNETTSVYVETAPWTFVRREVQTGSEVDGYTVITQGLSAGGRVVASGGVLLND